MTTATPYKTETGMVEDLPASLTVGGIEYEVHCFYNYMGKANCGIALAGALDAVVLPASVTKNGVVIPARLVRQIPVKAKAAYVATFSIDFYERSVSSDDASAALLSAFIAAVFAQTEETLTVTDSETQDANRVTSPSLDEMISSAKKEVNPESDTRLCWSCGGRFTYDEVKRKGGDWEMGTGCECGC